MGLLRRLRVARPVLLDVTSKRAVKEISEQSRFTKKSIIGAIYPFLVAASASATTITETVRSALAVSHLEEPSPVAATKARTLSNAEMLAVIETQQQEAQAKRKSNQAQSRKKRKALYGAEDRKRDPELEKTNSPRLQVFVARKNRHRVKIEKIQLEAFSEFDHGNASRLTAPMLKEILQNARKRMVNLASEEGGLSKFLYRKVLDGIS